MLSFVYDIADLYKVDTSIPAAFDAAKTGMEDIERKARICCRRYISKAGVLKRMAEDIAWIFDVDVNDEPQNAVEAGALWEEDGLTDGGKNYSEEV